MKMARKKKLENLKKKHYQYIKSLGVNIDIDSGKIESGFEGYPMLIYLITVRLFLQVTIFQVLLQNVTTPTLFLKVRQ